jgi:UPF0148 protein
MKDGNALCINCGKEPDQKQIKKQIKKQTKGKKSDTILNTLERKLEKLSQQLEKEDNPTKQQKLIKSIDDLIGIIAKLKKN